jgi:hypothetical protein
MKGASINEVGLLVPNERDNCPTGIRLYSSDVGIILKATNGKIYP